MPGHAPGETPGRRRNLELTHRAAGRGADGRHDGEGVLQGSGLTFTLPANATDFKTVTEVGVPVDVFAGIVLTHDGAFGAVSANTTTLNGANGLSFDSPFTPRDPGVPGGPVR